MSNTIAYSVSCLPCLFVYKPIIFYAIFVYLLILPLIVWTRNDHIYDIHWPILLGISAKASSYIEQCFLILRYIVLYPKSRFTTWFELTQFDFEINHNEFYWCTKNGHIFQNIKLNLTSKSCGIIYKRCRIFLI